MEMYDRVEDRVEDLVEDRVEGRAEGRVEGRVNDYYSCFFLSSIWNRHQRETSRDVTQNRVTNLSANHEIKVTNVNLFYMLKSNWIRGSGIFFTEVR